MTTALGESSALFVWRCEIEGCGKVIEGNEPREMNEKAKQHSIEEHDGRPTFAEVRKE